MVVGAANPVFSRIFPLKKVFDFMGKYAYNDSMACKALLF